MALATRRGGDICSISAGVASRIGCEIVKVYKDHGISGAKGRDDRPAFNALCVTPHSDSSIW